MDVIWAVFFVGLVLFAGVGLIYLADYLWVKYQDRPWKLGKRVWDYTDQWLDLRFTLRLIYVQSYDVNRRLLEKQGRLDVG